MFGHQDDESSKQGTSAVSDVSGSETVDAEDRPSGEPAEQPSTTEPTSTAASDTDTAATPEPEADTVTPATDPPADSPADDQAWPHPNTPAEEKAEEERINDIISPAGGFPKRPTFQYPTATPGLASSPSSLDDNSVDVPATHELIDIKKQALTELSPLIDQLDLPPEEKFRTIMMMIQASDDQTMVKAAYAAAHSIESEKTRAQALLDIINEVNYFTQEPVSDD